MNRLIVLACFAVGLSGCTGGFDRKAMHERIHDPSVTVSDADVAAAQLVKPQLKFPCRIAVYFNNPSGQWRWTAKDKEALETCGRTLVKEGIASDVFIMSPMFVGHDDKKTLDTKALRVAAAKHGADALFVVQGDVQTLAYKNPAALLNLTIVGGFLIPGSQCDAFFEMQGGLLDVSNGCLYMSVESEGLGKIAQPTFLIEEKDAIEKGKHEAVKNFGAEMIRRMRAVRDTMNQASTANPVIGEIQEVDPKTKLPLK